MESQGSMDNVDRKELERTAAQETTREENIYRVEDEADTQPSEEVTKAAEEAAHASISKQVISESGSGKDHLAQENVKKDNVYNVEDEADTQGSEAVQEAANNPSAIPDTSSKGPVFSSEPALDKELPPLKGMREENLYTAEDEADTQPSTGTNSLSDQVAKVSLSPPNAADPFTEKERIRSPSPPPPPPKDPKFLNAQLNAVAPSSTSSSVEYDEKHPPEDDTVADPQPGTDDATSDNKSEIQSIISQFDDGAGNELRSIMSPRPELAQPSFPPRASSLEPVRSGTISSPGPPLQRTGSRDSYTFSPSSIRPPSISGASLHSGQRDLTASPQPSNSSMFQPLPPSPDPEPALPFDFHRFLEQLRHRTADPVARFLRSFLMEFGKKQWMVHEQVKIISDFLEFISKKMAQCEVWRTVSDVEFDNAREGMEKLVMNRLYSQTFSPAIPPPEPTSPVKGRKGRSQATSPQGPGRRGQHQEDVERDAVIAQKIRIYGWIKEQHLDIAPISDKGRKFLVLAQQELLKINTYRAPRDKVICVLNCCKVLFGFLKNNHSDQSADAFVPLLIYTVLKANPDHLVSNVQYVLRFRNQDKLGGEAGYYISSLMGVVSFVENLDRTNLTITDEEFERNVEAAVSAIAERHKADEYEQQMHPTASAAAPAGPVPQNRNLQVSEKSTLSRPEVTPRNSMEAERASPRRTTSGREKSARSTDGEGEENASVAGLLRTIQKPLSTIGRIFSDDGSSTPHPALTPQPGSTPRLSPAPPPLPRRTSEEAGRSPARNRERQSVQRARSAESTAGDFVATANAEDAAARQASAEAAEAQRIRVQEHRVVVETLQGMFPNLDKDVISDVVRMKEGRVGSAVDACLALSG
ncbi:hypothetical protein H2203_001355 [Taxawa tesnikishii (nom. ined.)]|nr:hypothetical protein H2203_001355 [Dothideales sp. JES 119]